MEKTIYQTYEEQENYINSIPKFTKKNTLQNTKDFLNLLIQNGNKELSTIQNKIIHVAGTNGKGSTCNYLRELLLADAYSVGMFISPHLVTTRERIVIGGEMVSEEEFGDAFAIVLNTFHQNEDKVLHPTFFEFLFLMGMVIFAKKDLDFIILETGMGGRLDATNVFDKPRLTIITEIGLDHCQYLGETIEKIAMEKAGIIKQGVPLVSLSRKPEVMQILQEEAQKKGAVCHFVDKTMLKDVNITHKGIDFSFYSIYYNNVDLFISTPAVYQLENVLLALTGHELLCQKEVSGREKMRLALRRAHWQARMDEIADGVYLDGAHNVDGIEAFLETVLHLHTEGKRFLIFSVVDDKDYEEMIKLLAQSSLFDVYYIAGLETTRGLKSQKIFDQFSHFTNQKIRVFDETSSALYEAFSEKTEKDLIYVVGSLYLAGEVKRLLQKEDKND